MTARLQAAAEADILLQIERYLGQGLPRIARRFHAAVWGAIEALLAMPEAGPPRASSDPRLAGLRVWPIKGFDDFRIYYLVPAEGVIVVRVLHGKRDIEATLAGPAAPA